MKYVYIIELLECEIDMLFKDSLNVNIDNNHKKEIIETIEEIKNAIKLLKGE